MCCKVVKKAGLDTRPVKSSRPERSETETKTETTGYRDRDQDRDQEKPVSRPTTLLVSNMFLLRSCWDHTGCFLAYFYFMFFHYPIGLQLVVPLLKPLLKMQIYILIFWVTNSYPIKNIFERCTNETLSATIRDVTVHLCISKGGQYIFIIKMHQRTTLFLKDAAFLLKSYLCGLCKGDCVTKDLLQKFLGWGLDSGTCSYGLKPCLKRCIGRNSQTTKINLTMDNRDLSGTENKNPMVIFCALITI